MEHIVIWNPTAGKENAAKKLLPLLIHAFAGRQIPVKLLETKHAGHAMELAQQAAQQGESVRLYACGGDGTLNEVLHGAYPYPNASVACVPCGSGNDFLRNFGTQQEFLQFDDMILGDAIPIDLIQVNQNQIAASICSAGLDAKVAYGIPKFRHLPLCGGTMAYELSILQCLFQPMGNQLTLTVDGIRQIQGNYLLACIGNGQYYGGGYRGAPMAALDDGVLELILVRKVSRVKVASLLSKYKRGAHFQNGQVVPSLQKYMIHLSFKELIIDSPRPFIYTVDGECGPATHLELKVLPQAARFLLPKTVHQRYWSHSQAGHSFAPAT